MSEQTPEIGGRQPVMIEVEAGKSYWWCACGRSKKQPFCDGSHKGSAFTPVEWKAETAQKTWFCACKRTGKRPMCDGSHKGLLGRDALDWRIVNPSPLWGGAGVGVVRVCGEPKSHK